MRFDAFSMTKKYIRKLPIGRFGEVEEIANAATFMLSDYASWMTGEVTSPLFFKSYPKMSLN